MYTINYVTIVNRWCGDPNDFPNCLCRLSEAWMSLLDGNGSAVATKSIGNTCHLKEVVVADFNTNCSSSVSSAIETCLPSALGVKIESTTSQQIQVFEVQVFSNITSYETKNQQSHTLSSTQGEGSASNNKVISDHEPTRKYLIADVQAGLTNQAIDVWVALLMAEKLNRILVLPQVRPKIPSGAAYAGSNAKLEQFNYVWDDTFFIQCARRKLNKTDLIIASDSEHYQVNIDEKHTYSMRNFREGIDNTLPFFDIKKGKSSSDVVQRLKSDDSQYVQLIHPFNWKVGNLLNGQECFRPCRRLQEKIDNYISLMPKNYTCLHARTEIDWYKYKGCEGKSNTTSLHPEQWTCFGKPKLGEDSFKTPEQIAEVLKTKLSLDSSLWISSGSGREALEPLYNSFRVFAKEENTGSLFMDYTLAMVDKGVCSNAKQFWGARGSTFSMDVSKMVRKNGGRAYYY